MNVDGLAARSAGRYLLFLPGAALALVVRLALVAGFALLAGLAFAGLALVAGFALVAGLALLGLALVALALVGLGLAAAFDLALVAGFAFVAGLALALGLAWERALASMLFCALLTLGFFKPFEAFFATRLLVGIWSSPF